MHLMPRLTAALSAVFGWAFLALAALVTIETLVRKLFSVSLQGVDELGGYVLAVGSSLAFTIALIDRAHVRIDLVHRKLPRRIRAALDAVAASLLALFALLLVWVGYGVIRETLEYQSTAQTPWATPLIYPQGLWYATLLVFAAVAAWLAGRLIWFLAAGNFAGVERDFHIKDAMEELQEELEDLSNRTDDPGQRGTRTEDLGRPAGAH